MANAKHVTATNNVRSENRALMGWRLTLWFTAVDKKNVLQHFTASSTDGATTWFTVARLSWNCGTSALLNDMATGPCRTGEYNMTDGIQHAVRSIRHARPAPVKQMLAALTHAPSESNGRILTGR